MRMLQLPNAAGVRAAVVGAADVGQLHDVQLETRRTRSTTSARCSTRSRSTKTPGRTRSKAGRTTRTARRSTSARSSSPTWASESRVMTDYDTPITEDSERSVFAIEAKNEKALAEDARKVDEQRARRGASRSSASTSSGNACQPNAVEEPAVDVPRLHAGRHRSDEKRRGRSEERERVLPNSAVTVALGHLMMASDIEYLSEILEGFGQRERLASSADYQQVRRAS